VSFFLECSVPGFAENLSNSVSKDIIAEVGNTEDSLCGVKSVKGQYLKFGLVPDVNRCEEGNGQD